MSRRIIVVLASIIGARRVLVVGSIIISIIIVIYALSKNEKKELFDGNYFICISSDHYISIQEFRTTVAVMAKKSIRKCHIFNLLRRTFSMNWVSAKDKNSLNVFLSLHPTSTESEFKSSTSACNDFDFSQMCPENRIRASRSFWSDPKSHELTSCRSLGESSMSDGPRDVLHQ